MAVIKPFSGVRYNTDKVDVSKVVAPPYDVISQSMQNGLYGRDKHNVIRLILGKDEKKDTKTNNRYARARNFLNKWINAKVLIRDKKPSIYVHTQIYLHKGKKKTRIGFLALMNIEDPKKKWHITS